MALSVVRSVEAIHQLLTAQDIEDFEQELVDQYLLAAVGAGFGDQRVSAEFAVGMPVTRHPPHRSGHAR